LLCRTSANEATLRGAANSALLDQLVGARKYGWVDIDPDRLGRHEIDHEFESGRLLDRQITRLGAAYNLVDIRRATPPQVVTADSIGRNPT
jgi:hypothetical protein